jgi:hypothetical protein
MGVIETQLERLRARVGELRAQEVAGAGLVVRVPSVALPAGWSKPSTSVILVAPQGYPFAKPDCFWTDSDLRLANGNLPQNAQPNNPIPGLAEPVLWFSWHVDPWNPNRDDLVTWFTLIRQRLAQVQ